MEHRRAMALGVPALVAAIGVAWWWTRDSAPGYVTAPVAQGDIARAIVATGAVNPVVTVQVGTYDLSHLQSGRVEGFRPKY